MKRLFIILCGAGILYSCAQKTNSDTGSDCVFDPSSVGLPMELSYGGKLTLGNNEDALTVMNWNKRLGSGDTNIGDLLSDSVGWQLDDGTQGWMARDSAIAIIQSYMANIARIDIEYVAIVPMRNLDKNEDWVFSWTNETVTTSSDSVFTTNMHEDYLMKDGKIRYVLQYRQIPPKPAM